MLSSQTNPRDKAHATGHASGLAAHGKNCGYCGAYFFGGRENKTVVPDLLDTQS
jgi:hypothetical protein